MNKHTVHTILLALTFSIIDLTAAAPRRLIGGIIKREVKADGSVKYTNGSTGTSCLKFMNGTIHCLDRNGNLIEPAEKIFQGMEDLYEATGDVELMNLIRES